MQQEQHGLPNSGLHAVNANQSELAPLLGASGFRLYRRRWWILVVFSFFSMFQSMIWITFSPIAGPTKQLYKTTDFMINLLVVINFMLLKNRGLVHYVIFR
jgi:hypothetical protein